MVAVPTPSPRRNKTPAPAMPQALPLSKPNRNAAAAEMFTSQVETREQRDLRRAAQKALQQEKGRQLYAGELTPAGQAERRSEGIDALKGFGVGIPAGLLGLPADLLALLMRDAPQAAAQLAAGKSIDELKIEDRTLIDKVVSKFQEYAGAQAMAGYMGFGDELSADPAEFESSTIGLTPFRQGMLAGEIIADPVLAYKLFTKFKGVGSSTNAPRSEVLDPERVEPTINIPRTQLESPVIEGEVVEVAPGTSALEPGIAGLLPDQSRVADDVVDTVTAQRNAFDDILAPDEQFVEVENLGPQRVNYGHYPNDALIEVLEEAQDGMDTVAVSLIRNEMAGRRQGIFQEDTLENLRTQFADEIDQGRVYGANYVETLDDPIAPVREELPPLDITDAQGNRVEEDGFLSVEAGIGALDESNPVFNSTGLIIGATPNNYFARVKHYSPSMGALTKYVSSPKFARAADKNGRLAGAQWLSIIKNFRSGSPEVSGTGFESALLADPKKKFNAAEVRRLIAEKVPQTRVRTYLQSTSSDELDSIGEFNRVSHFRQQYYPEITGGVDNAGQDVGLTTVPEARIDFGVSLFGNTVPEIDLPGLGKVTPKSVNDHGYSWFPGYYGHSRFADFNVESVGSGVSKVMNPRVRFIGEIQSNDVSNQSSGQAFSIRIPPVRETKYFKTVDEYVEGYATFGEAIRPTYTEEWDKLLRLDQDLRGEKLANHSKLEKQIEAQENVLNDKVSKVLKTNSAAMVDPSSYNFSYNAGSQILLQVPRQDLSNAIAKLMADDALDAPGTLERLYIPDITNLIELAGEVPTTDNVAHVGRSLGRMLRDYSYNIKKLKRAQEYNRQGLRDRIGVYDARSQSVEKKYLPDSTTLKGHLNQIEYENLSESERLNLAIDNAVTDAASDLLASKRGMFFRRHPEVLKAFETLSAEEISKVLNPPTLDFPTSDEGLAVVRRLEKTISQQGISEIKDAFKGFKEEVGNTYSLSGDWESSFERGPTLLSLFSQALRGKEKSDFSAYLQDLEILKLKDDIEKLSKDLVPNDELADEIDAYRIAFSAHPAKDKITVAKRLADLSIESNGAKGYAPKTPYSDDGSYHEFSVRSAIREAIDDNNIDFVVFADPLYLANAPGRTPNDAFLRNYGPAVDKGLKEFGKANPEARAELYNVPGAALDDPNTIKFYGPSKIGSRAVHRGELKELPLRVLDVRKPAVKELMERPIRRAAGGMVRSGIGSMAKEVM